jgi:protein TonB
VAASSGGQKPKSPEPVPSLGGTAENRKKGFPPRFFGAVAGVLVLTSATVFILKPGKDRSPSTQVPPPVVAEARAETIPMSPTTEPSLGTARVSETGTRKGAGPSLAKANPRQSTPAVEEFSVPDPEDIKPLAPETALNLEIPAHETAPSPVGTAPMAADGGTVAAGTEAPVEIPAVRVRAGDLIALGEADVLPRQIRTAAPVYPGPARNVGKEGSIMINVLISETGDVIQTAVVGGDKGSLGFEKAAENAVRKWKFSPAEKDGVPVRVWKPVTIHFKLKK